MPVRAGSKCIILFQFTSGNIRPFSAIFGHNMAIRSRAMVSSSTERRSTRGVREALSMCGRARIQISARPHIDKERFP